jgi:hypothetical protein
MPMRPHNRGLRQAAGLAARLAPLACVCGLLATAPVRAEQAQAVGLDEAADERAAEQWLRFVERLNRYSALEPAGSHGSIGMALGAGAITQERPASALYPAQTMKGDDDDKPYVLPKLWVLKGFPLPIDVGAAFGAAPEDGFTQAGAHVQWTPFEALGMPAVTVRASYAKMFGMEGTSLSSIGLDAVASYGFLRYFTIYGALGAARHSGELTVAPDTPASYALADARGGEQAGESRTYRDERIEPYKAIGLRVVAWPPFVALTGEAEWADGQPRNYAAKVSVGM